MCEAKYWTWHMAAGVVILFLLGLHMLIMHVGGIAHLFAPYAGEATAKVNILFRDGKLFFTVTYILLLGIALYHSDPARICSCFFESGRKSGVRVQSLCSSRSNLERWLPALSLHWLSTPKV